MSTLAVEIAASGYKSSRSIVSVLSVKSLQSKLCRRYVRDGVGFASRWRLMCPWYCWVRASNRSPIEKGDSSTILQNFAER